MPLTRRDRLSTRAAPDLWRLDSRMHARHHPPRGDESSRPRSGRLLDALARAGTGTRMPILCILLATLGACAAWRPATVPLRTVAAPARCASAVQDLIVMLPGAYSQPEEFAQEGFVRILRERHVAADVQLVDAHFAYYKNRSIHERLHADVLQPARAKGYRSIWLVGISLGGVGSMVLADAYPGDINGIVMLAPYLGERETAEQIRAAGGLAHWPAPPRKKDDAGAQLWRWLKGQTQPQDPNQRDLAAKLSASPAANLAASHPSLPIYLGYGTGDRFVYNQTLLSESLPKSRVFTVAGGHDWSAWTPLWQRIVDELPLPRDASCAAP